MSTTDNKYQDKVFTWKCIKYQIQRVLKQSSTEAWLNRADYTDSGKQRAWKSPRVFVLVQAVNLGNCILFLMIPLIKLFWGLLKKYFFAILNVANLGLELCDFWTHARFIYFGYSLIQFLFSISSLVCASSLPLLPITNRNWTLIPFS